MAIALSVKTPATTKVIFQHDDSLLQGRVRSLSTNMGAAPDETCTILPPSGLMRCRKASVAALTPNRLVPRTVATSTPKNPALLIRLWSGVGVVPSNS